MRYRGVKRDGGSDVNIVRIARMLSYPPIGCDSAFFHQVDIPVDDESDYDAFFCHVVRDVAHESGGDQFVDF